MLAKTIVMAKAAGLTVIRARPLLLVVIPAEGAVFFLGCGMIAGNTTLGRTCDTVGNFLNLPMSYTELV
jgi:hypothetical protein